MNYYVNKTPQRDSGDHEVHKETCIYVPIIQSKEYLGSFLHCSGAVAEAKRRGYTTADGCAFCSPECHKS